jgi:hypothetical protein
MRIFLAIFAVLLFSGCASTQNYDSILISWKGQNAEQLITKWGEPQEKVTLSNGDTQYSYTVIQKVQKAPEITPSSVTVSGSGEDAHIISTPPSLIAGETYTLECNTWFVIDKTGTIIAAHSQGNDCTADEAQMKQFGF